MTDHVRDLAGLAARDFDVVIIGGGIYGATLARAAAHAGWSVALVEQGDYGEAASANSLKILHGGLRYLQQADVRRMRESIVARRDGLTQLPYLTRTAQFLAPARGYFKRSRLAYRVAALVNDVISLDRNRGVPATHRLPGTCVLSADEVRRRIPGADFADRGALLWSDGFIENTERYTLAYIMSARELGAVTANYVRAESLLADAGRVRGVKARDIETGAEFDIRARITINTSGMSLHDPSPHTNPSVRAYNLFVKRQWFGEYGVGLDNGTRNFFFAPWRDGTLIGTEYRAFSRDEDICGLSREEIAGFVEAINQLYPVAELNLEDVTFAHAGIVPAKMDRNGVILPEAGEKIQITTEGLENHWAVKGVKYTTAAYWADHLVKRLSRQYRLKTNASEHPLYGSEPYSTLADFGLKEETRTWLINHYGARAGEVMRLAEKQAEWGILLEGSPAPAAVVAHAVLNEQAIHVEDVILRRTDLGTAGRPPAAVVNAVARIMADLLGWTVEQSRAETRRLDQRYARLGLKQ